MKNGMENEFSQDLSQEDLLKEIHRLRTEIQGGKQSCCDSSVAEPLFVSLIDDAMFPIIIVAVDNGAVLYRNKFALSYFEVAEEPSTFDYAVKFWADGTCRKDFLQRLQTDGQVKEYEAVLLTAQKKTRHALLSSRLISYKNQDAIYTIFTDITEKVEIQAAYQQSENKYHRMYRMAKLMANTMPDLIWVKDLDDKYIFANPPLREKLLFCEEGESYIDKDDLFFAERERKAGFKHTFGEICINSDEIVKRTKIKGRFLEDGLVRGNYLVLDVHKAPMFDDEGTLIGTVGTGRDVTSDMEIQKALEESEGRFRLLANNMRDVLWISDATLTPTYVTPSVHDFSGYTPEEFIRIPFIEHMTPKYQRRFGRFFKRMIQTLRDPEEPSTNFMEFECRRKNGTIVWVEIATNPVWDRSGKLKGFTGMIRDSTKRVKEQQELKNAKKIAIAASQTKSEFLANMSHEIRTPMNGVLGILQLLQNTELTELQKKYVETSLGAGKSLLRLINDILDFSKIEAGKVECTKGNVALEPLVSSVMASFETMVDPKKVTLKSTIDSSVPESVVACGARLKQILFNLVGNAVKFTSEGSVELRLSVIPREDAGQVLLHFCVSDTGIGISRSMRNRLFEPFVQEDGSYRRKYGGTGLGLSIVKNLVEMMGGKITLVSTKGVGTEVSFTIIADILELKDQKEVQEDQKETFPEAVRVSVGKVLVVEDEQINAMVISAMLQSLGFEVEHAPDGLQAIKILKEKIFDCVFMDIQMPEMDGIETTREIRHSLTNSNVAIPIIALTAHAMKGDREQFISAGMTDYLAKPIEVERLRAVLKRLKLKHSKNGPSKKETA
ncbi:MAG: PAS domain S-box-containing protein [Desulforhopalus sp.]|jgi:PAS domain S-box-containing protein